MAGTVQVKLNNGNIVNVREGSAVHNTYKNSVVQQPQSQAQLTQHNQTNNQQRAQQNYQQWSQPQQTQQPSYSQPSQPSYSQPTQSVSSPSTGVNSSSSITQPTQNMNPSSNITNMLNNLKSMESQLSTLFNDKNQKPGQYNTMFGERNKLSASILDAISKENKGNISLKDLESLYGRRVENQEFEAYRENYTPQDSLSLSQLNNLWEHDFATRNNGEHYGFVQNYMNGDADAPIAQTLKDWLAGQSDSERQAYLASMQSSQQATQDYFTQRDGGMTPQYVNNTYNPAPWGAVSASDVIDNGGVKLKEAMEYYLKYGLSPTDQVPEQLLQQMMGGGQQAPMQQAPQMNQYEAMLMEQQKAMEEMLKKMEQEKAYKESQGAGGGAPVVPQAGGGQHIYNPGQTAGGVGYQDNQVVDNQILTQYLDKILKGGF